MFWIVTTGVRLMSFPPAASTFLQTRAIARLTSANDWAPVQTTLPERKSSAAVFGSFIRSTSPGNRLGSYSASAMATTSALRSSSGAIDVEATTFSIRISAIGVHSSQPPSLARAGI
jgi:hypothetical protein